MTWTSLFYIIPLVGMIYLLVLIWKGLSCAEKKLVKRKALSFLLGIVKILACIIYTIFVLSIISLLCGAVSNKGEKQ